MKRFTTMIFLAMSAFVLLSFTITKVILQEYLYEDITVGGEFKISTIPELSYSEKLDYHLEEIEALGSHYTSTDINKNIVENYNNFQKKLQTVVVEQKKYMTKNKITYNNLRRDPTIVPSKFVVSTKDVDNLKKLKQGVIKDSSIDLRVTLNNLTDYIEFSKIIGYTGLEIVRDATGTDNLRELAAKYSNTSAKHFGEQKRGLKASEALRKLKQLSEEPFSTFIEKPVSVFPNPIITTSKISFFNPIDGKVKFLLFEASGKFVESGSLRLPKGITEVLFSNVFDDLKKFKGLYLLKVERPIGRPINTKLIF